MLYSTCAASAFIPSDALGNQKISKNCSRTPEDFVRVSGEVAMPLRPISFEIWAVN